MYSCAFVVVPCHKCVSYCKIYMNHKRDQTHKYRYPGVLAVSLLQQDRSKQKNKVVNASVCRPLRIEAGGSHGGCHFEVLCISDRRVRATRGGTLNGASAFWAPAFRGQFRRPSSSSSSSLVVVLVVAQDIATHLACEVLNCIAIDFIRDQQAELSSQAQISPPCIHHFAK